MNKLYTFAKEQLLSSLSTELVRIHGRSSTLAEYEETLTEDGAKLVFKTTYGIEKLEIYAKFGEDSIVFSLYALTQGRTESAFAAEDAIMLTLGPTKPDALLGSRHDGPWWMYPTFTSDYNELAPRTQSLLVKSGALNYHLLPLTGDNFRAEFNAGKLRITSDMSGLVELKGTFLSVSASTDPLAAVENNFRGARALGAIRVPLREERELPELFRGFGWCTWDAFYKEVTSEKIYEKLTEFKAKNIPVKWVIIDDGWMTVNNSTLSAFEVDRTKFPEGLAATIARMKGEFGVEKVGVWHAFNGYWNGVDRSSKLYEEYRDSLMITPGGLAVQSLDVDKAFKFWDAWHTYLENEGVDFLKVDNQSSNSGHLVGAAPTAEACRIAHEAIERSISKHFNGIVIDCMGMDMENVLARPMSAVSRNSDDFFPKRERGFIKHLVQNVYNAIWHNQVYFCDFDMWWSDHFESATQSGVLRAISGSPIYVSDKIGESNAEKIMATVENDGRVMLCDYAARPTTDCVYVDCSKKGKLLKIWNRAGDNFAVAAFNVSDGDVTDSVDFGTIPGLDADTEYVAYEYFSKKFTRICSFSETELTLPKDGVAVWSIYPVRGEENDAYIELGDCSKYVPIAGTKTAKRLVSELV